MAVDVILRRLTAEERDVLWRYERESADRAGSYLDTPERPELVSGYIALRAKRLAGFLLYVLQPREMALTLMTVNVVPELRRRGLGSALLATLVRNMQAAAPTRIDALVGERDLGTQLFLRANGFRALRVLPAAFARGADDGYCFERRVLPLPPRPSRRRNAKRTTD